MSKILELYQSSDVSKLPTKKDRTPISSGDFDEKDVTLTPDDFNNIRKGTLNTSQYSGKVVKDL